MLPELEAKRRPHCATCGVDMWLTRIVRKGDASSSYVFECKVCGAETTLSASEAGRHSVEERL